ncbi:MAG: protein kinase [Deltaproteobacteria bacterium]|nr:protein kinase [Deltaproteobacteria bacterium]
MTVDTIPTSVGRYLINAELGRGSMGAVYLAWDPFIERKVAIKTAIASSKDPPDLEQFKKVFFNEARVAGRLMHPSIVALHDAIVEDDTCYLVMEYVEGATLKQYCNETSVLPLADIVRIIFQCAKALEYAHSNGVIHRDIKPSNILISNRGEAKVADFSIAMLEGASYTEKSGSLTGSVYYLSPEQLRQEKVVPQSDLFSLGVVMYELLTGVKPFMAETDVAVFYKILNDNPAPPREYRAEIPGSLETIVARALEKDPNNRYRSGIEMAADLTSVYDTMKSLDIEISHQERLNALKRMEFFQDFHPGELAEVIESTQWLEYQPDATIIAEGEIDDCFYVLVMGKAIVHKRGNLLAELKRGDCFGEMAYLGASQRSATIRAATRVVLIKMSASTVKVTSANTRLRFYEAFSRTLIQRLARASELLTDQGSDP